MHVDPLEIKKDCLGIIFLQVEERSHEAVQPTAIFVDGIGMVLLLPLPLRLTPDGNMYQHG